MANLLSVRKIVKIPSSKLSDKSKWTLRVSVQELLAENQIVNISSSHVTRVLDIFTQSGFSEQKVVELKQEIKSLSNNVFSFENRVGLRLVKKDLFRLQYIPHLVSIKIEKYGTEHRTCTLPYNR